MKIVTFSLLAVVLSACGGQDEPATVAATEAEQVASEASGLDESAAAYQARVQNKVSDSVVNSLAREWAVSQEDVRCVLGRLKLSQIQRVNSDPDAQAVFEQCGVDPAVVN